MDDFIRIFRSPNGDVYHITLSEDNQILSTEAVGILRDVTLVGIDLRRLSGRYITGQGVLAAIESTIAEFFFRRDNVIICYYCDFINPIPNTSKNTMPPQEYRSLLFEKMFQRYMRLHKITDIRLSVVEINGINEKYYFHVIYRERHSIQASIISNDLRLGYSK